MGEVRGSTWWATEEEAANPCVPPEDLPADRFLHVAFRTSSQVSFEHTVTFSVCKKEARDRTAEQIGND